MRTPALITLIMVILCGCDAASSGGSGSVSPALSGSAPSPVPPSPPTQLSMWSEERDDQTACLWIGAAATWPIHTLEWYDSMGDAYYRALDRHLKVVLKKASGWPDPSTSERVPLMRQAMKACRSLGLPTFGRRKGIQATDDDIEACATVKTVPRDASYAEADTPLTRAWHQADDFWLWDLLYHLNWASGDPKFGRWIDRTLERCRAILPIEPTPAPSG